LDESFGSAGKSGERCEDAELGEKSGCVAGPSRIGSQKSVERITERVDAGPHGFGIGDCAHDSGGIETEDGRGGGGPGNTIGEARDMAEINIANVAKRARYGVGERG
jgi:hypothetical protein